MTITRTLEKTITLQVLITGSNKNPSLIDHDMTYEIQYTVSPSGYSIDKASQGGHLIDIAQDKAWCLFGDWVITNEQVIEKEFYKYFNI